MRSLGLGIARRLPGVAGGLLLGAVAIALMAGAANAKIVIAIDKSSQRMSVTVDGAPRWTWPVSTGRLRRDTPSGSFTAFRMERDHYSKEWDDAPMPHSIFFTKKGHAIHGSYEVKKIGSPASAGCVRLAPENAAKLFALVEQRGVTNAQVVITGDVRVALARGTPQQAARAPREPTPSARRYQPQAPNYAEAPPRSAYGDPAYGRDYYGRPYQDPYTPRLVYPDGRYYAPQGYYQQPGYYQQQPAYPQGYYYRQY